MAVCIDEVWVRISIGVVFYDIIKTEVAIKC
ncbi:MAG: hypothetical protein ACI815_000815 [Psychroserpens sp.]|jgi:hypothetical protein